ncbi:5-oxoprolinase subunit PxpA [Carnimonas nigrificans]|uniref:5-oxoprolinase subunit PxpA n=1 Tax=Carnimonas nigrificans TaxID=64323 RepID=UPI000472AC29|nr:5-oxoprolinase subunit PxpA [Carnimonas nigrificans]
MARLLLNCDMGESFGNWSLGDPAAVLPLIDQANLACGFHAGDFSVMSQVVALAAKAGVSIGAHPSYPDLQGFGRRAMALSEKEVTDLMLYQIGALDAFCRANGTQVEYVKPHGALYHAVYSDLRMFDAALEACRRYREGLALMTLAVKERSAVQQAADIAGVPLLFEAFADRAYLSDGTLSPRTHPASVHHEPQRIIDQAVAIARGEKFSDIEGKPLQLAADTLCVHGDNRESLQVLSELRNALEAV